jgi:hypothetical protein
MTCIILRRIWWLLPVLAVFVRAQTCDNYGIRNGSSCLCPVGFGGSSCSQPGCGGTIFQGSNRPLTPASGQLANLTAAGCSCSSGWTGVGCNVCQTATACQSGFSAVTSISPTSNLGSNGNDTIVCNTQSRVYASSQMSCTVDVRLNTFSPYPRLMIHRTQPFKPYIPNYQL